MGEPRLKMVQFGTSLPEARNALRYLVGAFAQSMIPEDLSSLERVNIEINLISLIGNIIMVPKDETLIPETLSHETHSMGPNAKDIQDREYDENKTD
jgi:hypothetical protein